MSDGETLYRSILAAPADDAPRLVYADWLEEHGDLERAEIIRQMVHFRYDAARFNPPHPASMYWPDAPSWVGYVVRRGFVADIRLSTADFLAHAADLFSRHPITTVDLRDRSYMPTGMDMRGRAVLVAGPAGEPDHWPLALFPGATAGTVLTFLSYPRSVKVLQDAAVAFGRRAAGLPPIT